MGVHGRQQVLHDINMLLDEGMDGAHVNEVDLGDAGDILGRKQRVIPVVMLIRPLVPRP